MAILLGMPAVTDTPVAVADQARLQIISAVLEQLLGTRRDSGVQPVLQLTDRLTSSARGGVGRRPPALFIRRSVVDDGDRLVLRGELAHELGHLLDPHRWRDVLVCAFACGIPGGLAATVYGTGVAASWVLPDGLWWVAPALFACALVIFAVALASFRAIQHRAEYRADAIAAELAGPAAVRAWLTSMHADEQRRGRRPWAARLAPTHPRTQARLARLAPDAHRPAVKDEPDAAGRASGARATLDIATHAGVEQAGARAAAERRGHP